MFSIAALEDEIFNKVIINDDLNLAVKEIESFLREVSGSRAFIIFNVQDKTQSVEVCYRDGRDRKLPQGIQLALPVAYVNITG